MSKDNKTVTMMETLDPVEMLKFYQNRALKTPPEIHAAAVKFMAMRADDRQELLFYLAMHLQSVVQGFVVPTLRAAPSSLADILRKPN